MELVEKDWVRGADAPGKAWGQGAAPSVLFRGLGL